MRKLGVLVVFVLLMSCNDEDPMVLDGTYEGYFHRSSPRADYALAVVSLTFINGSFTGITDVDRYPAICKGSYALNKDQIIFTDSCVWTADFDWTYILSGEFNVSGLPDELILSRSYGEEEDIYQLTKK